MTQANFSVSSRNGEQQEEKGSDMADQCRPEVLFEATVHNANVLHICCQLETGTGGSVGAQSTQSELREAARVFRPHTGKEYKASRTSIIC